MRALLVLALLLVSTAASAQVVRRRFDPEDLDLEKPGVVHADLAFGAVRGEVAGRWLLPDFDIDVGLTPNVELGIDGAWAVEGKGGDDFSFDHRAPDNLWLSSKVGLLDTGHGDQRDAWAAGIQLGPRVATAPGVRGVGAQGLVLVGRALGRTRAVVNLGGLLDPGAEIARARPAAILTGVDLTLDLDEKSVFSIAADVSGVAYVSADKSQLTSTVGLVWSAFEWLDLSASGLVGVLAGGDRYGAYLNVAPKFLVF